MRLPCNHIPLEKVRLFQEESESWQRISIRETQIENQRYWNHRLHNYERKNVRAEKSQYSNADEFDQISPFLCSQKIQKISAQRFREILFR